jgi:hypothetical protein
MAAEPIEAEVIGLHACSACGMDAQAMQVALARKNEMLEIAREDIVNLERELRSKRATIKKLKKDQNEALRADPLYPAAMSVLEHWKRTCSPSARELKGVRLENCLARLRPRCDALGDVDKAVDELKRSCDGYALKPFVVGGRRTHEGPKDDWRADAELIFRSDRHVQQGLRIADQADNLRAFQKSTNPSAARETVGDLSGIGQAALRYASKGFHVFPCRPGEKRPATRNGLNDASRDQARIAAAWRRWPELNVAIRTGQESGFVVLDVDGEEGWESLHRLEDHKGDLPTTASVTTPSGGQHFYFAHPGVRVPNSASLIGDGLDIRGDGGYVLAPPSKVGDHGYEIDEEAAIAPLPGWLRELLVERQAKLDEALANGEYEKFVMAGAGKGNRNDQMLRIIGSLMAREDPANVAFLAQGVNVAHMKPPLPRQEVEKIVKSVIRMRAREAAA